VLGPAYRTLIEQLPPGALVPVPREELLELLAGAGVDGVLRTFREDPPAREADYSVREVAAQFGKAVSTVRGWCEAGQLPGAYRVRGREWRIPRRAIAAMQAEAVQAYQSSVSLPSAPSKEGATPIALDAWRRVTSPLGGAAAGRRGASG
jgi:excisionase family DNA binding protein